MCPNLETKCINRELTANENSNENKNGGYSGGRIFLKAILSIAPMPGTEQDEFGICGVV